MINTVLCWFGLSLFVLSTAGQLILPDALKLLPLYALSLMKCAGFRADSPVDERAMWLAHAFTMPCSKLLPLIHGRLIDLNQLWEEQESEATVITPSLALSSENLQSDHVYLLENSCEMLIWCQRHVSVAGRSEKISSRVSDLIIESSLIIVCA